MLDRFYSTDKSVCRNCGWSWARPDHFDDARPDDQCECWLDQIMDEIDKNREMDRDILADKILEDVTRSDEERMREDQGFFQRYFNQTVEEFKDDQEEQTDCE